MSDYHHLKVERLDGVVTCSMSNPPKHTLNRATLAELLRLVDELAADPSQRVFILTGGEEGYFFKYFELTELAGPEPAAPADETEPETLSVIHRLGLKIKALPQVTIAAINGIAGGGAVELSLSFDFRLMATGDPAFTYGSPQTTFGIVPCGGASVNYVRMLGPAVALDLLMHGDLMPPERALALGLVSRVYPKETFRKEVAAFAQNLASRAPLALQGVKRLVRAAPDLTYEEALLNEVQEFSKVIGTNDAKRALAAVIADDTNFAVPFHGN